MKLIQADTLNKTLGGVDWSKGIYGSIEVSHDCVISYSPYYSNLNAFETMFAIYRRKKGERSYRGIRETLFSYTVGVAGIGIRLTRYWGTDVITPSAVKFNFMGIFNDELVFEVWAYNIEICSFAQISFHLMPLSYERNKKPPKRFFIAQDCRQAVCSPIIIISFCCIALCQRSHSSYAIPNEQLIARFKLGYLNSSHSRCRLRCYFDEVAVFIIACVYHRDAVYALQRKQHPVIYI